MAQPDIHYFPDRQKYELRTKRRLATETLDKSLPDGFPKELKSPLAWDGKDYSDNASHEEFIYTFSTTDLQEIDTAVKQFIASGLPYGDISQETFPLPTLHSALRSCSDQIHKTRGFVVLRGIPVDNYSRSENVVIFAGISAHIGSQRGRQDHQYKGEKADVVVSHVTDLRSTASKGSIGTPAYTNDEQAFHNDAGEVVGLYTLQEAKSGGESRVASSWRVYNELARERPDLIRTLSEDWVVDRRKPATPFIERPVLWYQPATSTHPERILLQCSRGSFTNFGALPRSTNIPPITEAQAEALDAIHFLADRFHFSFYMKKGDIQYINDFSILHSRASFVDEGLNKRHLLRMWFRDPENGWETPEKLQTRTNGVYQDIQPHRQVFPLEPYVRSPMNGTQIKKQMAN